MLTTDYPSYITIDSPQFTIVSPWINHRYIIIDGFFLGDSFEAGMILALAMLGTAFSFRHVENGEARKYRKTRGKP